MANSVAIRARLPQPAGMSITPSQWRVLTDAIFPSAKTPEAIALALDYCAARKLDPFKKPVHIVPMWNSSIGAEVETIWPGINELQVTAARTGHWAGMDEPRWGPMIKRLFEGDVGRGQNKRHVKIDLEFPEWCAVTVYRTVDGAKCAFTEPVFWEEAYSRANRWTDVPNDMWLKRTRGQLHKVAKAASLRAAFPEEMGNDYTSDEMEGKEIDAGGIVIDGQAEPQPDHNKGFSDDRVDAVKDAVTGEEPGDQREPSWSEGWNDRLADELNATKRLKLLDTALATAPTKEDVEDLAGRPAMRDTYESAPDTIKHLLNEMVQKAVARFDAPREAPAEPDFVSGEVENV